MLDRKQAGRMLSLSGIICNKVHHEYVSKEMNIRHSFNKRMHFNDSASAASQNALGKKISR